MRLQFSGGLIPKRDALSAGLDQDRVPLPKNAAASSQAAAGRERRELTTVLSRADFVKDFSQTIDVGRRSSRPFRRDKAGRAHESRIGSAVPPPTASPAAGGFAVQNKVPH